MAKQKKIDVIGLVDRLLEIEFPKAAYIVCSEFVFDEILLHKAGGDKHFAYFGHPQDVINHKDYKFVKTEHSCIFENESSNAMLIDLGNARRFDGDLVFYFVYKNYYSRIDLEYFFE